MVKAMPPVLLCGLFKVHLKHSNRGVTLIQSTLYKEKISNFTVDKIQMCAKSQFVRLPHAMNYHSLILYVLCKYILKSLKDINNTYLLFFVKQITMDLNLL